MLLILWTLYIPTLLLAGAGGDDNDEPLSLSAAEERYADEVAVTAELKEMDEIYEVLAKVRGQLQGRAETGRTHVCW